MGLQLLLLTARMDHCIHQELLCHVAYISNFHLYHVVFRIIKYMDSDLFNILYARHHVYTNIHKPMLTCVLWQDIFNAYLMSCNKMCNMQAWFVSVQKGVCHALIHFK